MKRIFLPIIMCCGLVHEASAKDMPNCSIYTPNNTECATTLDNLHPGQTDVGLYVINMNTPEKGTLEKFVDECKKGKSDLDDDLKDRGSSKSGIAGIIAPDGTISLLNGHHHTYALNELSISNENKCDYNGYVYVYIVSNQSSLSPSVFQKYITDNNFVWLYSNTGQSISYEHIPPQLGQMGNNPYRSVIKLLEDSTCNLDNPVINADNATSYIEFIWADRLYQYNKSFINIGSSNAANYAVNSYNYIVSNFDKFADLPGAITPKQKTCKSF